jgi:hypothetical protein
MAKPKRRRCHNQTQRADTPPDDEQHGEGVGKPLEADNYTPQELRAVFVDPILILLY